MSERIIEVIVPIDSQVQLVTLCLQDYIVQILMLSEEELN